MSDAPKIVDLDALIPPSVIIKLGDKDIELKPPSFADILRLGSFGNKMEQAADLTDAELLKLMADVSALLTKCIPELTDIELSVVQTLAIVQAINAMSIPPDTKELEDRGLEVADPKVP